MTRSTWKGPIKYNNLVDYLKRNVTITPELIDKTFLIHNGKNYISVHLTLKHLGLKTGSLVLCKSHKPKIATKKVFKFKKK